MRVQPQPASVRAEHLPCVPSHPCRLLLQVRLEGVHYYAGVRGLSSARSKELKCEMRGSSENVG